MPALPACYSHYSRVELFRSSLNFREGRQAGMPALPACYFHYSSVELFRSSLDLRQRRQAGMPALPACYSHYSSVELFRSSLNFREGRQAGMPALPLLAEWLAVGIKFDYFTKAEFAHAGLNLPQVSNYYPDYFPGPNEFLSGC